MILAKRLTLVSLLLWVPAASAQDPRNATPPAVGATVVVVVMMHRIRMPAGALL